MSFSSVTFDSPGVLSATHAKAYILGNGRNLFFDRHARNIVFHLCLLVFGGTQSTVNYKTTADYLSQMRYTYVSAGSIMHW